MVLLVGVDTQVCHGMFQCGAIGLITGIENVLPQPVLKLFELCDRSLTSDSKAKRYAYELDDALKTLSTFDEGPDLVLYYKYLLYINGDSNYEFHFNSSDSLSLSQIKFAENHLRLFENWWDGWEGNNH